MYPGKAAFKVFRDLTKQLLPQSAPALCGDGWTGINLYPLRRRVFLYPRKRQHGAVGLGQRLRTLHLLPASNK